MSTSFIPTHRHFRSLILGLFLFGMLTGSVPAFAEEIELSSDPVAAGEKAEIFTASEIQDISSPSVIQIVQHIEGSAVIPSFIIDSESGSIAVDVNKDPIFINNINENLLGSGFFVSSDGYIVTNAHTVSDTTIKLALMYSFIEQSLIDATGEKDVSDTIAKLFSADGVDYMLSQTTFELSKDIIVLFPETIPFDDPAAVTIYDLGEIAQVVDVNDVYYKDGDNIAFIKIEGEGFPVISRAKQNPTVGESFYVTQAGFVSGIESVRDLSQVENRTSMFEEVVVVRDVSSTSTTLFSTNLVTDVNSVGGPVLNSYGEVVGVTTYDGSKGLSVDPVPLYVIPVEVIEEHTQSIGVVDASRIFDEFFKKGIISARDTRCEEASAAFAVALGDGNLFSARANEIQYLEACGAALKALRNEQENNSFITSILEVLQKQNTTQIVIFIGVFILIILIIWMILHIVKRTQRPAKKAVIEPTSEKRSDAVQQARRAPIKDMLPLEKQKEEKNKPAPNTPKDDENKREYVQKLDTGTGDILPRKKQTESVQKEEVFYTVPAKFPKKHDVASEVAEQEAVHEKLSEVPSVDADKLAKMWPHKYGDQKNMTPMPKDLSETKEQVGVRKERIQNYGVLQEAVEYIKHTRTLGFTDGEIEKELLDAGWILRDIENAFEATK